MPVPVKLTLVLACSLSLYAGRICTANKITTGTYDAASSANWTCINPGGGTASSVVPGDGDMVVLPLPTTGPVVYQVTASATWGSTSWAKPGAATKTVTGAANNGSGLCRLTEASTTGYAVGDYIAVQSIVGATACNGLFQISALTSTTIDLTGSTFSGTYTSGGTTEPAVAVRRSGTSNATRFIQLEVRPGQTLTTHADLLDAWQWGGEARTSGVTDSKGYLVRLTADDASGGANLTFDCSYQCGLWAAANTTYNAGIYSPGTASHHNTIRGKPSGGSNTYKGVVGYQAGQSGVGAQNWTYTDAYDLGGNSSTDYGLMAQLAYSLSQPVFILSHVTLTNSGGIYIGGAVTNSSYISLDDVRETGTQTTYSFAMQSAWAGDTTATRYFNNVRFDKGTSLPGGWRTATVTNSYFGGCIGTGASNSSVHWTSASNLFIRCDTDQVLIGGGVDGLFYFRDAYSTTNAHGFTLPGGSPAGSYTVSNLMYETSSAGADGNAFVGFAGTGAGTYNLDLSGGVLLENRARLSSGVALVDNSTANGVYTLNHMTSSVEGQWGIELGHQATAVAGQVASFRSGLWYAKADYANGNAFYRDIGSIPSGVYCGTADLVVAGMSDYNAGWHILSSLTGLCTNGNTAGQGNTGGYWARTTVAPGSHDTSGDPKFLNHERARLVYAMADMGYCTSPASTSDYSTTERDACIAALESNWASGATLTALMARIRLYLAPSNGDLRRSGHDGATRGAIEFAVGTYAGAASDAQRIPYVY